MFSIKTRKQLFFRKLVVKKCNELISFRTYQVCNFGIEEINATDLLSSRCTHILNYPDVLGFRINIIIWFKIKEFEYIF